MVKKMEFIPLVSVGGFKFNENIANYSDNLKNYSISHDYIGDSEWICYEYPDGSHIIGVVEGKIESIFCYANLMYKDTNLIGLSLEEFIQITQANFFENVDIFDFEEDSFPQYVYEFDKIGVQVWVKNHKIVTIIVSHFLEE